MSRGTVYLVGAGPGDPGLLTLRGREVLGSADVVYYDGLVSREVLRQIPRDVRRVRVAKGPRRRNEIPQARINDLLLAEAKAGRNVVRLKGGDPFLFSRGGEEAEVLRAHRIPFEVVPGVTSALAAPAFAGIPLTERRRASSVAIVTGHESASPGHRVVDWAGLARSADTLVILMGIATLGRIARALLAAGLPSDTPVAAIRGATTPRQSTVLFTLGEASQKTLRRRLRPPSVVVVGPAAARAARLHWNRREARWVSPRFSRREARRGQENPAPRGRSPGRGARGGS